MLNCKLEKDYLYCDGYYRDKSVEDAVKVVDKLLVKLIADWNSVRRETSYAEDDATHEQIDALRDCLYYLTKNEEYNNNPDVRQKFHESHLFMMDHGEVTEEEFAKIQAEETIESKKEHEKLHRVKTKMRRFGRVIIKERLYGIWALKY